MQITREVTDANIIRAWESGRVRIGDNWFGGNLIVSADTILRDWIIADPPRLTVADLAPALALEPEIILLGTGVAAATPDVELMADVAARFVGLEIMTTPAACRTYNVLVHEQRRVCAVLLTAG
jgi:uncharacterized protein